MELYFASSGVFAEWLEDNHHSQSELWLCYFKKNIQKPSITWSESVREALRYGWIDGLRKSIDEESYKIRFTPRRPRSHWSLVNIKMVQELISTGLMKKAGIEAYDRRNPANSQKASFGQGSIELPPEYISMIQGNNKAWIFFNTLPPSIKKPSIWFVINAKQEATRLRRLQILIDSSENGLRIPQLRR